VRVQRGLDHSTQPPMIADELRRQADQFVDIVEQQPRSARDPARRAAREAREPRHMPQFCSAVQPRRAPVPTKRVRGLSSSARMPRDSIAFVVSGGLAAQGAPIPRTIQTVGRTLAIPVGGLHTSIFKSVSFRQGQTAPPIFQSVGFDRDRGLNYVADHPA